MSNIAIKRRQLGSFLAGTLLGGVVGKALGKAKAKTIEEAKKRGVKVDQMAGRETLAPAPGLKVNPILIGVALVVLFLALAYSKLGK